MPGISELLMAIIGIAIFFIVIGAVTPTIISGLNTTYWSTAGGSGTPNLTTSDLANMRTMRSWFWLSALIGTIVTVGAIVLRAF